MGNRGVTHSLPLSVFSHFSVLHGSHIVIVMECAGKIFRVRIAYNLSNFVDTQPDIMKEFSGRSIFSLFTNS